MNRPYGVGRPNRIGDHFTLAVSFVDHKPRSFKNLSASFIRSSPEMSLGRSVSRISLIRLDNNILKRPINFGNVMFRRCVMVIGRGDS